MNYQGHYQAHTPVTRIFMLILLAGVFISCTSNAQRFQKQTRTGEDRTLSPYLQVINDDGNSIIPLKHTEADVKVTGVIADVRVTQVYQNEGGTPIEAIYVFPGSTRAAVHGMTMKIGERTVHAQIKKKEDARKAYEEAKQNGQSASLLEQHRPNVFQMNVANIMPGDSLVVHLSYTELLIPTDGVYEFVYPTVVGPRYNDDPGMAIASTDNAAWAENPYQREGELPLYTFNINAVINAGIPIKKAVCTSHKMKINFNGPTSAILKLDEKEVHSGNRDVIIRYGLRGGKVESGLLLFEGEKENFFLAMMEPPKRVELEMIPPREYVFVVDVSGSMNGFPLDVSKSLMRELLGDLRPSDSFNVLLFASASSVLSERSLPATKANIQKAITLINRQGGGGGTQLLPALERALSLPHEGGISRSIVIATDGYVTVEKQAFDLIRDNLGEANFFAFGIGSSVNRHLMEGLASIGKGEPFVLTSAKEAKVKAFKFREYITSPVLTDITVQAEGLEIFDVEPYSVPDVLADRPVIVFGKYKKGGYGKLTIKGVGGLGEYKKEFTASNALASSDNEALKFLWARKRIDLLDDYAQLGHTDEIKDEVTELGLNYGLLTAYTSFVAIDKEVRNENGELITVSQPLPLPQGVSDMAVGRTSNQKYSMNKRYKSAVQESSKFSEYSAMELEEPISLDLIDEISLERKEDVSNINGSSDKAGVFSSSSVEKVPEFVGGETAMLAFIQAHLKTLSQLGVSGISGKVYVEFIIGPNGKIRDVKVKRGIHPCMTSAKSVLLKG